MTSPAELPELVTYVIRSELGDGPLAAAVLVQAQHAASMSGSMRTDRLDNFHGVVARELKGAGLYPRESILLQLERIGQALRDALKGPLVR